MKNKIIVLLLIVLILIQFIPVDRQIPQYIPSDLLEISAAGTDMVRLVKNACYDCHSYESEYPFYANVAPLSMWIQGHMDHGREKLNFSVWDDLKQEDKNELLKRSAEKVIKKEMPLTPFLITHPEARISEEERALMERWFRGQMR